MNHTAHLVSEELLQDPKVVCFDGFNLYLLDALRQFFSEYNLTVIENAEANTSCLYQFICGPLDSLKSFNAAHYRDCQKRVVIVQEADIQESEDIGTLFNAQVARIGDKALSEEQARVVFGLLFSKESSVVTVSNKTNIRTENDTVIKKIPELKQDTTPQTTHSHWDTKEKDIENLVQALYAKKTPTRKRSYASLLLPLRYALITIVAFVSLHFLSFFISLYLLTSVFKGNTNILENILPATLEVTVITGKAITQPFSLITINTFYKRVIDNLDRTSIILKEITDIKEQDIPVSAIVTNSDGSFLLLLEKLKRGWDKISPLLAVMEGDIKLIKQDISFIPQISSRLDIVEKKIGEIRESGETLSVFSGLATKLTAQEKKYLLLFQNSNELRPTGGFVGSVGFLTFKNNAYSQLTIEDVYTIDGQLRGHVDPPLPIRTILNQEHWYLRDSNWSPNFETSAERALWFVDKSIGDKADGVIGISLSTIEDLLTIIGPVTLPDFQTTVDSSSLFTFIHKTTQEDFFPGSQKKRDVLTALSKAVELKLRDTTTKEFFHISLLLAQKLKSRDIQFYSVENALQQELNLLGITGLFPPKITCTISPEQLCVKDFFAVVEANLAVNKTNAYVSRQFTRDVTIKNKELVRLDTAEWKNSTDDTSIGGGNYTMYSRHYYPTGTSIDSLTINDTELETQSATSSSRPLPYAELIDEFPGFVTLGIAQDVLPGKAARLKIHSSQPLPDNPRGYALSVFRQAGTKETPFWLSFSSPNQTIQTDISTAALVANNGSFTYNRRLQRDEQVFVALTSEDP